MEPDLILLFPCQFVVIELTLGLFLAGLFFHRAKILWIDLYLRGLLEDFEFGTGLFTIVRILRLFFTATVEAVLEFAS